MPATQTQSTSQQQQQQQTQLPVTVTPFGPTVTGGSVTSGGSGSINAVVAHIPEDPFGSAPFSLPAGLREKATTLRKTGGKA